jgi:integrase
MFNTYRRLAGVTAPTHGHRGLHSLRYTVAARLLEVCTPMETISQVLGHSTIESTNVYTRVDIVTLRSAAINPDSLVSKEVRDE